MSLTLSKSVSAMAVGRVTSVVGQGGTEPYAYSLGPSGPGGSIDAATGFYTAPAAVPVDPSLTVETIIVTDAAAATASGGILITSPVGLLAEILQSELGLADGRVWLWDQKNFEPEDDDLYMILSVPSIKVFGNTLVPDSSGSGVNAVQSCNVQALVDIDIKSRSIEAFNRKEEVLLALKSVYAQSQQVANSFFIGKLPAGGQFVNLSLVDGAAIPYRYRISVFMQYAFVKTKAVPYFDTFQDSTVTIEP